MIRTGLHPIRDKYRLAKRYRDLSNAVRCPATISAASLRPRLVVGLRVRVPAEERLGQRQDDLLCLVGPAQSLEDRKILVVLDGVAQGLQTQAGSDSLVAGVAPGYSRLPSPLYSGPFSPLAEIVGPGLGPGSSTMFQTDMLPQYRSPRIR